MSSQSDQNKIVQQEKHCSYEEEKDDQVKKIYTLDDYSLIIVIGKGSYGKVVLVKNKDDKQLYAMKILKKKEISKQNQVEHIITERNVLVNIKHPFIIQLKQSFQSADKLYFIMEYCPGGELYNLLKKRQRFSEDQTRFYAAQILLALEELHSKHIIYRDLKPENVLIDIDGYLRVADFGLSKGNINGSERALSMCGTPEYIAPEVIIRQGYEKPVDWWSFGCIIYEMLVGLPPFMEQNREKLFQQILTQEPEFPKHLTQQGLDLIKKLLVKDPQNRLGTKTDAKEIKEHPWFKNLDWGHLLEQDYAPPFTPLIKSELDVRNFDREFTEININSMNSRKTPASLMNTNKYYLGFSYMNSNQDNGFEEGDEEDEEDDDEEEDEEEEEEEENNQNMADFGNIQQQQKSNKNSIQQSPIDIDQNSDQD